MTAAGANARFYTALGLLGGVYAVLIVAMIVADLAYTTPDNLWEALQSPQIRYAIKLSLISCLVTAVLSLWVAVPLGYLMSRTQFRGKPILETIVDIPIILPPLVIGLSLLILFQTTPGRWIENTTAHRMGFLLTYLVVPALFAFALLPLIRRYANRGEALRGLARASAATGSIDVLGFVTEDAMEALWRRATAFAMLSYVEGFVAVTPGGSVAYAIGAAGASGAGGTGSTGTDGAAGTAGQAGMIVLQY